MPEPDIEPILNILNEINDDASTPRNVKDKMSKVISILKEGVDVSIKVHKALAELDDITNDSNMDQFTRTQIWNIVSLLEKI